MSTSTLVSNTRIHLAFHNRSGMGSRNSERYKDNEPAFGKRDNGHMGNHSVVAGIITYITLGIILVLTKQ